MTGTNGGARPQGATGGHLGSAVLACCFKYSSVEFLDDHGLTSVAFRHVHT